MSKIKELKAAFEASTRTNKGDAEFIALAHNLMPQLLEAVDLLGQAKRALDEFDKHTRGVMIPDTRFRGRDVTSAIYTLLEELK